VYRLARTQIDEIFIIDPEPRRFWSFGWWAWGGRRRRPSASSR